MLCLIALGIVGAFVVLGCPGGDNEQVRRANLIQRHTEAHPGSIGWCELFSVAKCSRDDLPCRGLAICALASCLLASHEGGRVQRCKREGHGQCGL